jgi:hypothetical protein
MVERKCFCVCTVGIKKSFLVVYVFSLTMSCCIQMFQGPGPLTSYLLLPQDQALDNMALISTM